MRNLIKEPLVQFLVGGLLLYAFLNLKGSEPEDNPYTIEVSEEALLTYLQFQNKSFDAARSTQLLGSMDTKHRARLETDFIRDEILVREAENLGLNKDDEIIRRRLIQKMDFIIEGFATADQQITEQELKTFYEANHRDYTLPAEISFTHLFFSKEKGGLDVAKDRAEKALTALKAAGTPKADRFYFHRNYIEQPRALINDHFGSEITSHLFGAAQTGIWQGPLQSEYGYHLIYAQNIKPERQPLLEQVAARVLDDLRRTKRDQAKADAIEKLKRKYTIVHKSGTN
ncbi:peptidyl-prolyl cis-trans isomerase [Kordiimonas sp. SCSIO 12603]|uniref:peptidylprolyl isomerase n=1 Tax=Kordiimonas sp. SCSIO 12603 TaxID=2829596 RepID=UPI00210443EF|nr:peptidylprolyl isomerase [Kordiimonas sp. SCSIO 12603]UTW59786.1 peptidyl-prolyl cis-trans isomerase [Kordiimonas sp. SCSIO 12603]